MKRQIQNAAFQIVGMAGWCALGIALGILTGFMGEPRPKPIQQPCDCDKCRTIKLVIESPGLTVTQHE